LKKTKEYSDGMAVGDIYNKLKLVVYVLNSIPKTKY